MNNHWKAGLAFVLAIAAGQARAQTVTTLPVVTASGATANLQVLCYTSGIGIQLCSSTTALVSPLTGQIYNMTNGQPFSPAIAAGYPVSRSILLTTAGTSYQAMIAASTTPRKAGYCQASFSNQGTIGLSVTGTAAAPPSVANDAELRPGQTFDLNQHGYAEQGPVSAVSTASGDYLLCQEVQ